MVEIHFTIPALIAIGEPAIPALTKTLADDHEIVRLNAGQALEKIGAPATAALVQAVQDESLPVDARANSALALGRIGPIAKEAIPALKRALEQENPSLKDAALYALPRIEGPSPPPTTRRR